MYVYVVVDILIKFWKPFAFLWCNPSTCAPLSYAYKSKYFCSHLWNIFRVLLWSLITGYFRTCAYIDLYMRSFTVIQLYQLYCWYTPYFRTYVIIYSNPAILTVLLIQLLILEPLHVLLCICDHLLSMNYITFAFNLQ